MLVEGEHDGLTANKILRRRDMPLSRQQWLFGERSVNQGPWLRKGGRIFKNNAAHQRAAGTVLASGGARRVRDAPVVAIFSWRR